MYQMENLQMFNMKFLNIAWMLMMDKMEVLYLLNCQLVRLFMNIILLVFTLGRREIKIMELGYRNQSLQN